MTRERLLLRSALVLVTRCDCLSPLRTAPAQVPMCSVDALGERGTACSREHFGNL